MQKYKNYQKYYKMKNEKGKGHEMSNSMHPKFKAKYDRKKEVTASFWQTIVEVRLELIY